MYSGLKKVLVVGSIGTCVMCFQASWSTMWAASGSQRMLNSRRGLLAYSSAKALPEGVGIVAATHEHELFRQRGELRVQARGQRQVRSWGPPR